MTHDTLPTGIDHRSSAASEQTHRKGHHKSEATDDNEDPTVRTHHHQSLQTRIA